MDFSIIVASARARSGKTLLVRLLAEHFVLGRRQPIIFETDVTAAPLAARFPDDALALDIDRVTDQMTLFDGISAPAPNSRILDLAHSSSKKFFDLMENSDFVNEARANELEPVIFYVVGPDANDFQRALRLRRRAGDCPFILVENMALAGANSSDLAGAAFHIFDELQFRMLIPPLDPFFMELLEERDVSIDEFIREPTLRMAPETRNAIQSWLVKVLGEIYRVLGAIERGDHLPAGQF